MNVKKYAQKFATKYAPILGAGAVGVCPLCWLGSASLLTYVGLGALIPLWQGFVFALIGFALVGFYLDYRSHKNIRPILLLLAGSVLLYVGRYVMGFWPVWVLGAGVMIVSVLYNKKFFTKESVAGVTTETVKETAQLTCPHCQHVQEVGIPQTGCLAFHKCEKCEELISVPEGSDNCCVICEYSDKKCPVAR